MKEWRTERTGWRDEELSRRHGCWGFNCPAVDLDFLMLEYNHGKPCALVEYKHINARPVVASHATYRALSDLADGYVHGPLPCLVAIYDPRDWSFRIIPLNQRAMDHYSHCEGEALTEKRFVRSLHLIRKKILSQADEDAIAALNGCIVVDDAVVCQNDNPHAQKMSKPCQNGSFRG
jgi:hypothetical protein